MPTKRTSSDDSITEQVEIIGAPDARVSLLLREIRRERTGLHALAAIAERGRVLAHDTFNLGRSEDRRRLAKAAHEVLSVTVAEFLTKDALAHHLDMLCLYAATEWEGSRVEIVDSDPNAPVPGRILLLPPHIEAGTGTIFFAPPGTGKSFLLTLMAVSLTSGIETIWGGVRRTPCLYVDLERNELSFRRRLNQIRQVMKVELPRISYLKGRGLGLSSLKRKLRGWVADHPGAVLLYDSISRMGGGSLVDDDVANAMIDLANGSSETWVALAHSPRADASHAFGSQMFDAGADMMVKLTSEHRGAKLGCALTVTKANHTGSVPIWTYEMEFDEHGLVGFGRCNQADWPELAPDLPTLLANLLDGQQMSATELAEKSKTPRPTVIANLEKDARFVRLEKVGKEVLWGFSRRAGG